MTDATNAEPGWVLSDAVGGVLATFTSTDGKYELIVAVQTLGRSNIAAPTLGFSLHEKGDRDRIFYFNKETRDAVRKSLGKPIIRNDTRRGDPAPQSQSSDVLAELYPSEPTEGMREFLKVHPRVFDGLVGLKGFERVSPGAITKANELIETLLSPGRGIVD